MNNTTTPDGLPPNGLPLNGLPVDGLPVDGLPVDGLPVDGLPVDGLPQESGITVTEVDVASLEEREVIYPKPARISSLEITDDNGEFFVIGPKTAWPRRTIEIVALEEIDYHGQTAWLLGINNVGYLYFNETTAHEDFDAIVTGAGPVRLRNAK